MDVGIRSEREAGAMRSSRPRPNRRSPGRRRDHRATDQRGIDRLLPARSRGRSAFAAPPSACRLRPRPSARRMRTGHLDHALGVRLELVEDPAISGRNGRRRLSASRPRKRAKPPSAASPAAAGPAATSCAASTFGLPSSAATCAIGGDAGGEASACDQAAARLSALRLRERGAGVRTGEGERSRHASDLAGELAESVSVACGVDLAPAAPSRRR